MHAKAGWMLAATLLVAGCASSTSHTTTNPITGPALPTLAGFTALPVADAPVFTQPLLIDTVRAGGEPVIAITHAGTVLVSAHPGFTHYHPSDDPTHAPTEIAQDFAGQSYMWRSTDNGTTWTHIGFPNVPMGLGPRSAGLGVSDPEYTVMPDGAICFTDLENLAMSSTSCSQDDGQTWLIGNAVASGGPTDRQWLASYGKEFYFTANYFTDHHIRASTDYGLTWEDRGDVPCEQDLVAKPQDGHLVVGCTNGISVSTDAGNTWSEVRHTSDSAAGNQRIMSEPAVDSAGNIWVTYTHGERGLYVAGTPDEGKTWPWVIDLTPHFRLFSGTVVSGAKPYDNVTNGDLELHKSNGTYVWPWISAGSDGRMAVSWIGSYKEVDSGTSTEPWYIFTAFILGGNSAAPTVVINNLTPDGIHTGPICQAGTTCQVASMTGDDGGDRRLGDFFETTISPEGYLYGAWSNTMQQPNDVISHPQFVRQTGGIRLIDDATLGSWVPTQG